MSHDGPCYRYTLELYKKKGDQDRLATFAIQPDWEPALEWARFSAIRKNPPTPLVFDEDSGSIEPIWHRRVGSPYLEGLRAIVGGNGRPAAAFDIPLTYFASLARAASSRMIEQGKLESGEQFQYLVCAYASEGKPADAEEPSRFSVKTVGQVLDASDLDMTRLLSDSRPWGPVDDDQMPVYVPQQILEEAVALMAAAGDRETGGILIGHLHRDPGRRELFLEVTAQVQAQYAEQELTRLTFTPETWTAVDAALALRARGEIYVGWWHTHPARHWCDECPPETRARCTAAGRSSGDFFSAHDVALHRAVFPRAYSVALVISDGCESTDPPIWRLFGWRYGMLMARGFHVLRTCPEPPHASEVAETSEVLR